MTLLYNDRLRPWADLMAILIFGLCSASSASCFASLELNSCRSMYVLESVSVLEADVTSPTNTTHLLGKKCRNLGV